MFTVNPDGSITTDSAAQALELQRLITESKKPSIERPVDAPETNVSGMRRFKTTPAPVDLTSVSNDLKRTWGEVIGKLVPHHGQIIDSFQLEKLFELQSVKGVGVKVRHLRSLANNVGLTLDDVLIPQPTVDGFSSWKVNIDAGRLAS